MCPLVVIAYRILKSMEKTFFAYFAIGWVDNFGVVRKRLCTLKVKTINKKKVLTTNTKMIM